MWAPHLKHFIRILFPKMLFLRNVLFSREIPELSDLLDRPINSNETESLLLTMPTCQTSDMINIRDLLSHRVCLVDDAVSLTFGIDDDRRATYAERIRYLSKSCDFRTKYKYSNSMYGMAGYAIESACAQNEKCRNKFGSTWESGMSEIFRHLGMSAATLAAEVVRNRAV